VNYVYGTSGALAALGPRGPTVASIAQWCAAPSGYAACKTPTAAGRNHRQLQRPNVTRRRPKHASQTAWALIGLLETVQRLRPLANDFTRAIELGVDFLLRTQRPDGNWTNPNSPAPASPSTST